MNTPGFEPGTQWSEVECSTARPSAPRRQSVCPWRNYLCTPCADFFQILVVGSRGPHISDFFTILFLCVNMGPYESKHSKRLLLQVAAESFQTYSEFSSRWSSHKYVWDFWTLQFKVLNNFISLPLARDPIGVRISETTPKNRCQTFSNWIFLATVFTNHVEGFWYFRFLLLNDFFFEISISPWYPIEKPKTSFIWK